MITRKCRECGREFEAAGSVKICSDECRAARARRYRREYMREFYRQRRAIELCGGKPASPKTCPVCGKVFLPREGRCQVCSDECGSEWLERQQRKRREQKKAELFERKAAELHRAREKLKKPCEGAALVFDQRLGREIWFCAPLSLKSLNEPCTDCALREGK